MTNMENDDPDGFWTLPETVQRRLRMEFEKRTYVAGKAFWDDLAAVRASFDIEIDRIYADPMAYPYSTRVAEVDRLVEQYHADRRRLATLLEAGLAIAKSLFYSDAALASVKGETS